MNKTKQEILYYIDKYIIPELEKQGFNNDVEILKKYKELILFSKHYSLPDGGRLMEITDFNVPLEDGFILPKNSVTFDYIHDDGALIFILCTSIKASEIEVPLKDNGFINAVMESGSDTVTMIVQFAFDSDFCGVNPVVAVIGNKCIVNKDGLEFFPIITMEQIAGIVNVDKCSADIVEDVFCAYELGLALSCGADVNKDSKKGFVRHIDGKNKWFDDIANLSLVVN